MITEQHVLNDPRWERRGLYEWRFTSAPFAGSLVREIEPTTRLACWHVKLDRHACGDFEPVLRDWKIGLREAIETIEHAATP